MWVGATGCGSAACRRDAGARLLVIFGCPSLKIVPRAALVSASCPPKSPLDQLAGLAERELASAADPVEAESTDEECDAFLAHFEKRKVSIGTCARAYATPCVHEHVPLTEIVSGVLGSSRGQRSVIPRLVEAPAGRQRSLRVGAWPGSFTGMAGVASG